MEQSKYWFFNTVLFEWPCFIPLLLQIKLIAVKEQCFKSTALCQRDKLIVYIYVSITDASTSATISMQKDTLLKQSQNLFDNTTKRSE